MGLLIRDPPGGERGGQPHLEPLPARPITQLAGTGRSVLPSPVSTRPGKTESASSLLARPRLIVWRADGPDVDASPLLESWGMAEVDRRMSGVCPQSSRARGDFTVVN